MSTTELKQDVKQAVRELDHLVNNASANGMGLSSTLREKISPFLDSAKEGVSAVGHEVKERAAQVARKTDAYAHTNPWQIAGVAALVGLTVGVLATRRR